MKQRKISIIIPVYNVEDYLERCIQSVLKQAYSNLEIILVDDGSTDKSGLICDEYQIKYSNIKTFHQENGGLAAARNTGLKYAAGDYITFLDSDDYISDDTYIKLSEHINKQPCDICFFGHYRVKNGKEQKYDTIPEQKSFAGKQEIIYKFFSDTLSGHAGGGKCFSGISVCCALYKRELIKDLIFKSEKEILSEDIVFNTEACIRAKQISICPEYLYYYVYRDTSLTKKYRKDRFEAALRLDQELKRLAGCYNVEEWLKNGIRNCFFMNLIVCLKQEAYFTKENGRQRSIENIKKMGLASGTVEYLNGYDDKDKKRKIIFNAIKKQKWSKVYWLVRLWTGLETILHVLGR